MKGTSHLVIGAGTGFLISSNMQTSPEETIALVGLGAISGLIPDLDIGGKLRNKLTFPYKTIRSTSAIIGVLLILYSYLAFNGADSYLGMGIGLVILFLASMFRQKHMLLLTGIGIMIGGYFLETNWILLLGIYIIIASLSYHRSYTHSLLGLCFFSFIVFELGKTIHIDGVFQACILSYLSHLIADSKLIPFQKRGVPLLLPITKKEF